jgi:cytochrome c peroxidase
MKHKNIIITAFLISVLSCKNQVQNNYTPIENLKALYSSGDASKWPKPNLDSLVDKSTFQDIYWNKF